MHLAEKIRNAFYLPFELVAKSVRWLEQTANQVKDPEVRERMKASKSAMVLKLCIAVPRGVARVALFYRAIRLSGTDCICAFIVGTCHDGATHAGALSDHVAHHSFGDSILPLSLVALLINLKLGRSYCTDLRGYFAFGRNLFLDRVDAGLLPEYMAA